MAVSAAHKAKVVSDGGGPWCGDALSLRLELSPDSPDVADAAAQLSLLNRLKDVLSRGCPEARSGTVSVVTGGRALGRFASTQAGGWIFAAAPDAAAAAPAPRTAEAASSGPPPRPAAGETALPSERDYGGALLALLHQQPSLATDAGIIEFWASFRHPREFDQLRGQEFRLQPLLADARSDLAASLSSSPPGVVSLTAAAQFGAYDFKTQRFPLAQPFTRISLRRPCCVGGASPPSVFEFDLSEMAAFDGVPMAPDDARRFLEARTSRSNAVDRSLVLLMVVRLDGAGFKVNGLQATAAGVVDRIVVLNPGRDGEEIARIGPDAMRDLRLAEAAREAAAQAEAASARQEQARAAEARRASEAAGRAQQVAEQQRSQMIAQRSDFERVLSAAPLSARLANAAEAGPVDAYARLSNLREARAQALIAQRPASVVMLVQAAADGTAEHAAEWPQALSLVAQPGAGPLSAGRWYVARGELSVPDGDDAPPARLEIASIVACEKAECADVADPAAILRRKLGPDAPP